MELCEQVEREIAPALTDMGYEVVRVSLSGGDVKTLQIMAERLDRVDMTVDDCANISRTVSALLDVADPIAGRYTLEVSSPGLDRPLVRAADYDRFVGDVAKVELDHEINGRRRFKGRLKGTIDDGQTVCFDFDGTEMQVAFRDIVKAKLVLTDELIQKHQMKQG
jgi:ribosome maturation factor RimP